MPVVSWHSPGLSLSSPCHGVCVCVCLPRMDPDGSVRVPLSPHSGGVNCTEYPGSSGQHSGPLLRVWCQRSDNGKLSEFFAVSHFPYW